MSHNTRVEIMSFTHFPRTKYGRDTSHSNLFLQILVAHRFFFACNSIDSDTMNSTSFRLRGLFVLALSRTIVPSLSFAIRPLKNQYYFPSTFCQLCKPSKMTTSSNDDDDQSVSTAATSLADEFLDQILDVAVDASKKAGDIILGNAGGANVSERKANSRDLLTLIDPLCEKVG